MIAIYLRYKAGGGAPKKFIMKRGLSYTTRSYPLNPTTPLPSPLKVNGPLAEGIS